MRSVTWPVMERTTSPDATWRSRLLNVRRAVSLQCGSDFRTAPKYRPHVRSESGRSLQTASRSSIQRRTYRPPSTRPRSSATRLDRLETSFKKGAVNVLHCCTTMEMGVDIGGLSSVLPSGSVGPAPSNISAACGDEQRTWRLPCEQLCTAPTVGYA